MPNRNSAESPSQVTLPSQLYRPDRRRILHLLAGSLATCVSAACSTVPSTRSPIPEWEGGALQYDGLLGVARLIQTRKLSPVELTEMMLTRISTLDVRLKSYATIMRKEALTAAHQAESEILAGHYRGPLHGIPVAVKDLFYTRGTRTMGGMAVMRDFVPNYDATAVSRLEAAGAVLLGKLNLTEGAMAGYHPDFEIPVNPWGENLWVGASSSGSGVAVAAGLCFAALGTDTGGSIRFPCMANGVVGLKPTYGRVSRYGVIPLAESMDHVGPMTRRVADAAAVLQVIAGNDPHDPSSLDATVPDMMASIDTGVAGLKIGFDREYASSGVDPALFAAIEQASKELTGLGAELVEIWVPPLSEELKTAWFTICAFEAYSAHEEDFTTRPSVFGPYLRGILQQGSQVKEEDYNAATELRSQYSDLFVSALSKVDALLSPGGGIPFHLNPELQYQGAEQLDPAVVDKVYTQFTFPADFSGVPTLSLPCGISPSKVPWTMQLTGSPLSEPLLCRIGKAYEDATPWHQQHPDV